MLTSYNRLILICVLYRLQVSGMFYQGFVKVFTDQVVNHCSKLRGTFLNVLYPDVGHWHYRLSLTAIRINFSGVLYVETAYFYSPFGEPPNLLLFFSFFFCATCTVL